MTRDKCASTCATVHWMFPAILKYVGGSPSQIDALHNSNADLCRTSTISQTTPLMMPSSSLELWLPSISSFRGSLHSSTRNISSLPTAPSNLGS